MSEEQIKVGLALGLGSPVATGQFDDFEHQEEDQAVSADERNREIGEAWTRLQEAKLHFACLSSKLKRIGKAMRLAEAINDDMLRC